MTVRNRILILLVSVALIFLGSIAAIRQLDEVKFDHLVAERERNWRASVERFLAAQDAPPAKAADDLAANVALAEAILARDRERLAGMLDDAELSSRGIHAAWVYTSEGDFLQGHAHAASALSLETQPVPDGELEALFAEKRSPHFYYRLPDADSQGLLVEVRGARVAPAFARDDPARTDGYLLIGRLLGEDGLAELPLLSPDDRVFLASAETAGEVFAAGMRFERVLSDWRGQPLARLIVANEAEALQSIETRGDLLFRQLIAGVLLLFTLLFLLLGRSIVSPLRSIIRALHRNDLASIEKLSASRNELGELARLIHLFFRQRHELVDEMEKRVAAEKALRLSEEMLSHSQKMEAVGRLAGGVAHDFNNLLTAIIGFSELLQKRHADNPAVYQHASLIHQAGQQATGLTRQLLAFSRKQFLQPKVVDLNVIAGNLHKLLARIIGRHIEMRTDFAAEASRIRADPGQIEQVILNLGVNARDAMPRGGILTIRTSNVRLEEGRSRAELPAGEYVQLEVIDTGEGMNAETQARIFEPFFTTKGAGKGTGLGLATVYGIVKQSRAGIEVESASGRGSTFRIYLPVENAPLDSGDTAPLAAQAAGRSARILLVENDEIVRSLMQDVLRTRGHTVLAANSGDHAVALAREHCDELDLLISEVVLPGRSGPEVANAVREVCPTVRVLLVSGYSEADVLNEDEVAFEILPKPFTPGELTVRVAELLI